MTKYIALLRAINVGGYRKINGYRKIKMKDLREMFTLLGFENVATYIQSGNVIFEAPETERKQLEIKIQQQIQETFGYDVPVLIRKVKEVEAVLGQVPFEEKEGWTLYIVFLSSPPDKAQIKELETQSSNIEKFRVQNQEVYSFVDKTTSEKPRFSTGFIEKHVNMPCTARNLRTVNKILERASLK